MLNPDVENINLTEFIIAKQRGGPTGTVYLNFKPEYMQFEDIVY
jgi:replicative DNA helicase